MYHHMPIVLMLNIGTKLEQIFQESHIQTFLLKDLELMKSYMSHFHTLFQHFIRSIMVLFLVFSSSIYSGWRHFSGMGMSLKPGWQDSSTNHVIISMNNCVLTLDLSLTIFFWSGVILPQRTQYIFSLNPELFNWFRTPPILFWSISKIDNYP